MSADLHEHVEQMLETLNCDIGGSECHGVLCGMLCGPNAFDQRVWIAHTSGQDDCSPYQEAGPQELLDRMVETTYAALEDGDFEFSLLLPGDDVALAVRARAFADWCRGFLSGFGLSGVADLSTLGEDTRGFLQDLERFCAVASDDQVDEDDERALQELIEFTRMGVMLLREEARDTERNPSRSLH